MDENQISFLPLIFLVIPSMSDQSRNPVKHTDGNGGAHHVTVTTQGPPSEWKQKDDEPRLEFNLLNDRKRTTITPRDVASLVLFTLMPLTHPLAVEAPRWCCVHERRRVRHALVVFVDGLTFDDVRRPDWHPAGSGPVDAQEEAAKNKKAPKTKKSSSQDDDNDNDSAADTSSSSSSSPKMLTNTWLAAVRQLGASVQYVPLWINNTTGRLEGELFMRPDRNQKLRRNVSDATTASQSAAPSDAAALSAERNGARSSPIPGSGGGLSKASSALEWARRQMKKASDSAAAAAGSDGSSPGTTPGAASAADAGTAADPSAAGTSGSELLRRALSAERREKTMRQEERKVRVPVPDATLADWGCPVETLVSLAMTPQELADHGFPQPPSSPSGEEGDVDAAANRFADFLPLDDPVPASSSGSSNESPPPAPTPHSAAWVSSSLPPQHEFAVALDCEMVQAAGQRSMLARVSVVRVPTGEVLLDEIVKPEAPIVDYVTRYSGMTPEIIEGARLDFNEARAAVKRLISRETFVIGHGLENDFAALRLLPTDLPRMLDTTQLYPHPNGLPNKNALRYLAVQHLGGRRIQTGVDGHDSVEDASVCIELVGLKIRHGRDFGAPARVNLAQLLAVEHRETDPTSGEVHHWPPVVVNVVERADIMRRIGTRSMHSIPCRSDSDAVRKAIASFARAKQEQQVFVYTRLGRLIPHEPDEEGEHNHSETAERTASVSDGQNDETDDANLKKGRGQPAPKANVPAWSGCNDLNARLAKMINAAPCGTMIVVLAAMCPLADSPNKFASSHGSVFAFVKTDTTPRLSETPEDYTPRAPSEQSAVAAAGCAQQ